MIFYKDLNRPRSRTLYLLDIDVKYHPVENFVIQGLRRDEIDFEVREVSMTNEQIGSPVGGFKY